MKSNDERLVPPPPAGSVALQAGEEGLNALLARETAKEWYGTDEFAGLVGKAEFTVREWCRLGRVRAEKKKCGRGPASEWIISHAELTRIRNEGLLPDARL